MCPRDGVGDVTRGHAWVLSDPQASEPLNDDRRASADIGSRPRAAPPARSTDAPDPAAPGSSACPESQASRSSCSALAVSSIATVSSSRSWSRSSSAPEPGPSHLPTGFSRSQDDDLTGKAPSASTRATAASSPLRLRSARSRSRGRRRPGDRCRSRPAGSEGGDAVRVAPRGVAHEYRGGQRAGVGAWRSRRRGDQVDERARRDTRQYSAKRKVGLTARRRDEHSGCDRRARRPRESGRERLAV
jgi:hypothetical protein